ncbi:MAG: sugar phosphate isomerase/epimerase [Thermoguttaceae bacterium]|nr:sugar phosphate isomerase/epimerase [Thermoguttaceae bacterium]
MDRKSTRRAFLGTFAGGIGAAALGVSTVSESASAQETALTNAAKENASKLDASKVRFCLNTGTILAYNLPLTEELKIARAAGYRSVEIWLTRLQAYSDNYSPAKLAELRKWLDGEGMRVEGGIGFAPWIVDDADRRAAGLEQLKREAEALAAIGCACVAAPASGANEKIPLSAVADRYRAVLELCEPIGVRPLLETWGASATLGKLSDALAICAETGRSDAALLLDAYHLYRGGNSFAGLNLIDGKALPIFHLNDYPGTPEREKLNDSDRVFPGDGVAPLREILATLLANGFDGALSLELFNPNYRKEMSPLEQAKVGLEKMRALFA